MTQKSNTSKRLSVVFNEREITIDVRPESLKRLLQGLLGHLIKEGFDGDDPLLHLHLRQIEEDFLELEEQPQRREQGAIEYILHHTREWITDAFIDAFPELLWLHAGGVVDHDRAVLMPGPAGAGKSTMAVMLVERGWHYLSDDIVPVDPRSNCILPFPFTPAARGLPPRRDDDANTLPEQEKTYIDVLPEKVYDRPATAGCIVFPEFSPGIRNHVGFEAMTAVAATQMLMAQCASYEARRERTIAKLFELARAVPCFHLTYSDPNRAVGRIAGVF